MNGELSSANEIEARHLEAISRFGHQPVNFTFDRQLDRVRHLEEPWRPERERFWRTFSSWSPSRFELIELIPFYSFAGDAIRMMRQMSADRHHLPDIDFVIASDPSRLVSASVDDSASEPVDLDGSMRRIVWMNVGLMNFFKDVAKQSIWTLVRPRGGLKGFLEYISAHSRAGPAPLVRDLLTSPFDARAHLVTNPLSQAEREGHVPSGRALSPAAAALPSSDRASDYAFMCFMRSFTTFVAGHEIGHVYVGHTRTQGPVPVLVGDELERVVRREAEADAIGLYAVWDGMAQGEPPMSIDVTWLGPVLFLSSMVGMSLLGQALHSPKVDDVAIDRALFWRQRLGLLAKALMVTLAANRFEPERVHQIGRAIPPLASAIVEWLRLSSLQGGPAADPLDLSVYDELREVCA